MRSIGVRLVCRGLILLTMAAGMAAAAEPEQEVSLRRSEEQAVLYTVAHGGYEAIGSAMMEMHALASETGLTPLGPFWLVYLTPLESAPPAHWVVEVRMPVGREAYHVADDLEEDMRVKTVPAMDLAVASMPGRIEDPAPVRRDLLAWMAANGCVAAGPMRQSLPQDPSDASVPTELACPVYGYAELGAPAGVSPPPAGAPEPRTTDASIRTHGEQWGVSTEHIGAVEGSGRFDVEDLKESGINTFRIYGDMARFEPEDDDGVYGAPTIEQIKANPDAIPWDKWDALMDAPDGYAYADVPGSAQVSNRQQFAALREAGVRTVIALRNRDTKMRPDWSPAVPVTEEDWNEWWAYCFAMAYWLNVRNDYRVDDYEVLNEPDWHGEQGWTGTQEQYFEMVRRTHDAVDHVYKTYLPGREYHILAPVSVQGQWVPETLEAVGDQFDSLDTHYYGDDMGRFARTVHRLLREGGRPDYPLWVTEWGTFREPYDDPGVCAGIIASLIRGSRPGDQHVYGSHLFCLFPWGTEFDGLVRSGGVRTRGFYAMRMACRALQGGRPTYKTTADSPDLTAITTRNPTGGHDLLIANESDHVTYRVTADLSPLSASGTAALWRFDEGAQDEEAGEVAVAEGKVAVTVPPQAAVLVHFGGE